MSGGSNAGRKRVRLFGPDPLPNFVFSLDTNRQALPLHLFSQQAPCSEARNSPTAHSDERTATTTTTAEEGCTAVASSGDAAAQHPSGLLIAPGVQLYPGAKAARSASRGASEQEIGGVEVGAEASTRSDGKSRSYCNTLLAARQPSQPSPATPGRTRPPALSKGFNATATSYDSDLLQLQGGGESRSLKSARPKTTLEAAAAHDGAHDTRAAAALRGSSTAGSSEKNISATDAVKEKSATPTAMTTEVAIPAPALRPGELLPLHGRTTTLNTGTSSTAYRAEPAGERATAAHRAGGPKDDTETAVPVNTTLPGTAARDSTRRTDDAGRANEVADAAGKGRAEDTAPSQPRQQVGSAAASMVASFLKRGLTPAPAPAPSPTSAPVASPMPEHPQGVPGSPVPAWSTSPPATPTPLASLVTGVPPGSGGSAVKSVRGAGSGDRRRWHRNPSGIGAGALPNVKGGVRGEVSGAAAESGVRSPHRVAGGSRFFNDEWSPRLKERRRIVRFPKRNEPVRQRGRGDVDESLTFVLHVSH